MLPLSPAVPPWYPRSCVPFDKGTPFLRVKEQAATGLTHLSLLRMPREPFGILSLTCLQICRLGSWIPQYGLEWRGLVLSSVSAEGRILAESSLETSQWFPVLDLGWLRSFMRAGGHCGGKHPGHVMLGSWSHECSLC